MPAKDHVTLIRSFALVSAAMPDAELHILGEGSCRDAISQTAESLGIAKRVFLHGAGFDVAGFLSTLDLFVLSSGRPDSLAEQILHAANRQDLPAIGEATRRWAQKFGIQETWHQYQAVFEASLVKKVSYPGDREAATTNDIFAKGHIH